MIESSVVSLKLELEGSSSVWEGYVVHEGLRRPWSHHSIEGGGSRRNALSVSMSSSMPTLRAVSAMRFFIASRAAWRRRALACSMYFPF